MDAVDTLKFGTKAEVKKLRDWYGDAGWQRRSKTRIRRLPMCGAVMYAGMAWLSMTAAMIIHAVAAPLVFGTLASRYHRARPEAGALATAAAFTGTVMVLDAVIVAGLVEKSFAMFASVPGTWLPFALIFLATWLAGRRQPG